MAKLCPGSKKTKGSFMITLQDPEPGTVDETLEADTYT